MVASAIARLTRASSLAVWTIPKWFRKSMGSSTNSGRTADQTLYAKFWPGRQSARLLAPGRLVAGFHFVEIGCVLVADHCRWTRSAEPGRRADDPRSGGR